MTKPRKKYRPKPISYNTINYVIGGFKKLDEEHMVNVQAKNSAALWSISSGHGTKEHFDVLVGMSNMAKVLCETQFDFKYMEILRSGQDALEQLGKRYLKIKKFVLTGEELRALNDVMEVHEAQLYALRVVDIERCYQEVQRRLRHGINLTKIKESA